MPGPAIGEPPPSAPAPASEPRPAEAPASRGIVVPVTLYDTVTVAPEEPRPVAAAPAPAAPQPGLPEPPTAEVEPRAVLVRMLSLAELGFADGIQFTNLNGARDIFFRVPNAATIERMTLRLAVRAGAAHDSIRHIKVLIADRIARTVPLDGEWQEMSLDIDVRPSDIKDGFLKVGFDYGGAIGEFRCIDERAAGDFVLFSAASGLEMRLYRDALIDVGEVAAVMPPKVAVALPPRDPSPAVLAAALRTAALYRANDGYVRFGEASDMPADPDQPGWAWGQVRIDDRREGAPSRIAVTEGETAPEVVLSGSAPVRALDFLSSEWRTLRGANSYDIGLARDAAFRDNRIPLSVLGADTAVSYVVDQSFFDASFAMAQLPPGQVPERLAIGVIVAPDPQDTGAVVTAFMNETLLGSTTTFGDDPAMLDLKLPEGLLGGENGLRISVQRRPMTGDCLNPPQGFAAQLLASSAIDLIPRTMPPNDFFELIPDLGGGSVIAFDPEMKRRPRDVLAHIAPLVASLQPADAMLDVSLDGLQAEEGRPFIYVGERPPPGSTAPLRFDRGRVIVQSRSGETLFEGASLAAQTVAQIVEVSGRHGLWIRPGHGAAPGVGVKVKLDRGNLAIVGEDGVSVATATERSSLVRILYPDEFSLMRIVRQYSSWIIVLAWIAVTFGLIVVLQKVYRRRKAGAGN